MVGTVVAAAALRLAQHAARRLLVEHQGVSTIALAGYLLAAALPLGLAWLTVQVARSYPSLRWLVPDAAVAVIGLGVLSGVLTPRHFRALVAELSQGVVRNRDVLLFALTSAVATAGWVLVAIRLLVTIESGRRAGGWIARHRTTLTLVAAAGPLPYGLIRLTWLTPWPLLS
jgi:hypothetical protein